MPRWRCSSWRHKWQPNSNIFERKWHYKSKLIPILICLYLEIKITPIATFQITYRKTLGNIHDKGDAVISEGVNSIVWAIGKLARPGGRKAKKVPSFHDIYPKTHVQIDLKGKVPDIYQCQPFVQEAPPSMLRSKGQKAKKLKTWGPHRHFDYSLRTFDARLGPPGGAKGYSGITGMPSNGYVW